ncbi:hypothetical protein LOK49_LG04G00535 [Camellia lanceoleosa]|uniref:Uncharacterized protein n=1 Tax=Camellia lanceoleosa TaxID=1840588 RepID=A0ACC0I517_9ERIC|nr:hypothetical protein LOK49_LG04G00535 [Camellia lanceoleosa]
MRLSQLFEMYLNLIRNLTDMNLSRDLGGRRKRISERRSTLLAMTSDEAGEVSDEEESVINFSEAGEASDEVESGINFNLFLKDILFSIVAAAQRL